MKKEVKDELERLTKELDGTMVEQSVYDCTGRESRRVIITYPKNK